MIFTDSSSSSPCRVGLRRAAILTLCIDMGVEEKNPSRGSVRKRRTMLSTFKSQSELKPVAIVTCLIPHMSRDRASPKSLIQVIEVIPRFKEIF